VSSRHESERFSDAALQRMFSEIWAAISRMALANPLALAPARSGGIPPRPTGITKTEGPGTFTIAWGPVSIADLLYYEVQVSTDPAFVETVFTDQAGANARYTYQDGTAGTTYYARVRTVNQSGNASEWSATINSQTGQVTAAGINVPSLGAITTNLGSVELDPAGNIRAGQVGFNLGTGFFLGFDGGAYKFSIGNPGGAHIRWDGTDLIVAGAILNQTLGSAYTVTLDAGAHFSIEVIGTHSLGARTATPSGGTAPYTYLWSVNTSTAGGYVFISGDATLDTIGFGVVVSAPSATITATVTCKVTDNVGAIVYVSFTVDVAESSGFGGP
jgi:hypothetical protein